MKLGDWVRHVPTGFTGQVVVLQESLEGTPRVTLRVRKMGEQGNYTDYTYSLNVDEELEPVAPPEPR